jgi:mycofactocin precursor
MKEREKMGKETRNEALIEKEQSSADPCILEEVVVEELAVDGICGIY